jgi:ATP adenylyltransferase
MFEPGTLWTRVVACTEQASRRGAQQPIATKAELVSDGGVDFLIRVVSGPAREQHHSQLAPADPSSRNQRSNPFLPYAEDLFVADVSDTHVALLNKYSVMDHHLLLVTRRFEDQELPLTVADLEAVCRCMAEFDGVAFYNGGAVAGASEPHRHLQFVPLPLASRGPKIPLDALLTGCEPDRQGRVRGVPFAHAFTRLHAGWLRSDAGAAALTHQIYWRMLEALGLSGAGPASRTRLPPYNLLLTREWMLLVPRTAEHFGAISINALGFAGALLVCSAQQWSELIAAGPMAALRRVAPPASL